MTIMAHYVAVLPPNIRAHDLTEDWRGQVRDCQERRFTSWTDAPVWLKQHPHKRLDWGTIAYELEDDEARALIRGEGPPLPPRSSNERCVAIWVECC